MPNRYMKILCLTSAVVYVRGELRRRQILYAYLSDDVKYFFIPADRETVANTPAEADEAGALIGSKSQKCPLLNTVTENFTLANMDFLLVESDNTESRVTEARVFRVKGNTTEEYRATIPNEGDCFQIQSQSRISAELGKNGEVFSGGNGALNDPTVKEEVNELCKDEFSVLGPPLEIINADQVYEGGRENLFRISLAINDDSSALVKSMSATEDFTREAGFPSGLLYMPVCNSVFAALHTVDASGRKFVNYLFLPPSGGQISCENGEHFEEKLTIGKLHEWDVDVGDDYNIVRRRKRSTVEEIRRRRKSVYSWYDGYTLRRRPSMRENMRDKHYLRKMMKEIRRSSMPPIAENVEGRETTVQPFELFFCRELYQLF